MTNAIPAAEKQAPSEMVKVVARLFFGGVSPDAIELARVALETLGGLGYRIVPAEPTEAMWASVNVIERGHVSKLCSVEGWRAMLEAAK